MLEQLLHSPTGNLIQVQPVANDCFPKADDEGVCHVLKHRQKRERPDTYFTSIKTSFGELPPPGRRRFFDFLTERPPPQAMLQAPA